FHPRSSARSSKNRPNPCLRDGQLGPNQVPRPQNPPRAAKRTESRELRSVNGLNSINTVTPPFALTWGRTWQRHRSSHARADFALGALGAGGETLRNQSPISVTSALPEH